MKHPTLAGVVDGILSELGEAHDWILELKADLATSEERRARLAQALDSAVHALDPEDRPAYDMRVEALLGDLRVPTGRPPADSRHDTVMTLLAGWGEDVITTADIRLALERRGLAAGKNYGANLLKNLAKRSIVLRTGHGRYRITRMHPQLVARRNGLWDRLRERNAGRT